jgi:lactobin A/cerein 7B family class IIb bacteriocin
MYSENLSISAVKANMFDKRTVVELTENQMTEIDGGATPAVAWAILEGVAIGVLLYDLATRL